VGIFQSFEWSVYRKATDSNPNHPVFIFGAINFFFFICVGWGLIWLTLAGGYLEQNDYFVLFGLIGLSHILTYTIFAHAEARYIAPALPLIVVLAIHLLARTSLQIKITLFLITVLLYSLTWHKLTQFPKLFSHEELFKFIFS
jgi:hypothetical protein